MATQKKVLGKLPVPRGEYVAGTGYGKYNLVTLYGSTYMSKEDSNNTPPATLSDNGKVVVNTEKWKVFADASLSYESGQKITNTGVEDYPLFSTSDSYVAGYVVNYQGKLYKFNAAHAAGAWIGTDVDEVTMKKDIDDKLTELEAYAKKITTEYNVSTFHPTSGISGGNKYDLAGAIGQVPAELRTAGVKVSFLNESGNVESWEFSGGSWAVCGFEQVGAGRFGELDRDISTIRCIDTTILASINEAFRVEVFKNIKKGQKIKIGINCNVDIADIRIDDTGHLTATQIAFDGKISKGNFYTTEFTATEDIESLFAWTIGSNVKDSGSIDVKINGELYGTILEENKHKSTHVYTTKEIEFAFDEPSGEDPKKVANLTINYGYIIATYADNSYLKAGKELIENAPYSYGALYAVFNKGDNKIKSLKVGALAANVSEITPLISVDESTEFCQPIACWYNGNIVYCIDSRTELKKIIDDVNAKITEVSDEINLVNRKIKGFTINDDATLNLDELFTKTILNGVEIGEKYKIRIETDENVSCKLLAITSGRSDTENRYFWGSIEPNNVYEKEFEILSEGDIVMWTIGSNIIAGGTIKYELSYCGLEEIVENLENPTNEFSAYIIPPSIYTVCNDINWKRNYSLKLYIDHLFADVNKRPNVRYSDGSSVKCFYSKYNSYGSYINSTTSNNSLDINEKIIQDILTNGQTINIPHRSVRNKATSNKVVRLLCIGDSVTEGYMANYGIPYANAPKQYWSWIKALFEMDYIEAGNQGYFFESLGNLLGKLKNGYTFNITGMNGINKDGIKAFACGVGGSKTSDWISPQLNNEEINPFYDIEAGKFSLRYWVEKYRTLTVNPDGTTTRCSTSNKGELAPEDTTQYNVCEPTHVLIQLGYNQLYNTTGETRNNYLAQLNQMITTIKEEYPDIYVLLSLPDTAGTYYPELFPEYIGESDDIYSLDFMNGTAKSAHDKIAYMNKDLMEIADEDNKIYYVPTYFASPLCYGASIREISEVCYLSNGKNKSFVQEGGLPYLHPNNAAHANWAYQIYSLIKYTLLVE